jgi:hypothetical protein
MSGADSGAKEHASGPEDTSDVPTQRRGSCTCGHPDVEHDHHVRGGADTGACRRSRLRGGFGLAEQLVVALRRGR